MVGLGANAVGQGLQIEQARVQPLAVWMGIGQLGLDLIVGDDAACGGVDQEHLAGFEPPFGDDLGGGHLKDAALAGKDDAVIDGAPPPSGP